MNYDNHTLRHMLAAEYALGTLRERARARFERLLAGDDELRSVLAYWEGRLGQLGLALEPVAPPASVWEAIEARLGRLDTARGSAPGARTPTGRRATIWDRLGVWRGWAALATAAVLALVIGLWAVPEMTGAPGQAPYVSVLSSKKGEQAWLVTLYPKTRQMRVTKMAPYTPPRNRSLELWLLPGDKTKAVSLGLVQHAETARVEVSASAWRHINPKAKLAVSVEPEGGSPTGQHTGPILSVAQLMEVTHQ